jgi:hypothetical protein
VEDLVLISPPVLALVQAAASEWNTSNKPMQAWEQRGNQTLEMDHFIVLILFWGLAWPTIYLSWDWKTAGLYYTCGPTLPSRSARRPLAPTGRPHQTPRLLHVLSSPENTTRFFFLITQYNSDIHKRSTNGCQILTLRSTGTVPAELIFLLAAQLNILATTIFLLQIQNFPRLNFLQ